MDKGVLEWLNVLNWLVYLNGWVFLYKLNGCGFDSRCSHWSKIKLEETPCVFFAKLYWNYSSSVVFYYFSIGLVLGKLWGTFYRKVFKSISGSLMFFWWFQGFIVGRGFINPYLMETPLYCLPPFFKFCPTREMFLKAVLQEHLSDIISKGRTDPLARFDHFTENIYHYKNTSVSTTKNTFLKNTYRWLVLGIQTSFLKPVSLGLW